VALSDARMGTKLTNVVGIINQANMYQQFKDLLDKIGPYPEKPEKPVLDRNHNAEQAKVYAMLMLSYENAFAEFEKARMEHLNHKGKIEHEIREMIRKESGLDDIPEQYRWKVWELAWKEGHSAGYYEVYHWLCKLVEIFE